MTFLFYFFSALVLFGGLGVVFAKNPVSAAFSMVISFLGMAALFIQLDAFLIGVLQVLVYAGAIMVLFLFIIMLLDVEEVEKRKLSLPTVIRAGGVGAALVVLISTVLMRGGTAGQALPKLVASPEKSDVLRIGELLFGTYWLPIQIIAVLLLTATVGVVVLSKRELK